MPDSEQEGQTLGPMIRTIDVWKQYSQDGGEETSALAGASMEIAPGQIVALLGKSGSGKTTLLNLIAGLDQPTRGSIEVDGQDLRLLGEAGRTAFAVSALGSSSSSSTCCPP